MCQLNGIGNKIAKIDGINAITDVTGFGLGGHLSEVCLGSKVSAEKHPVQTQLVHAYQSMVYQW
jgi:selenophosphate synthase